MPAYHKTVLKWLLPSYILIFIIIFLSGINTLITLTKLGDQIELDEKWKDLCGDLRSIWEFLKKRISKHNKKSFEIRLRISRSQIEFCEWQLKKFWPYQNSFFCSSCKFLVFQCFKTITDFLSSWRFAKARISLFWDLLNIIIITVQLLPHGWVQTFAAWWYQNF